VRNNILAGAISIPNSISAAGPGGRECGRCGRTGPQICGAGGGCTNFDLALGSR
jgi:hypothetical protein